MKNQKEIVKKGYLKIAKGEVSGCSCSYSGNCNTNEKISKSIGYSQNEVDKFKDANLGLGCGNPTALAEIKKGNTVLDLGSGAGFDAFLVVKKVGKTGRVIGVDMTKEMIEKAKQNAKKYGYDNVEFKLGDIEKLPIENNSVDVVISNCVINLAPNKDKVFREAYRVLKKNGKMFISDIVLLKELSEEQKENEDLLVGCVGGAILKEDYLEEMKKAGFEVKVLSEDKNISKRQYNGIALTSLRVRGVKK